MRTILLGVALLGALPAHAAPPSDQPLDILVPDETIVVPPELTFRARVAAMEPAEPTDLAWRHGGEGLGGLVFRGTLGEKLAVGAWSEPVPLASLVTQGKFPKVFFVTFTAGRGGTRKRAAGGEPEKELTGASQNVRFEFEFLYRGKLIKRLEESGPRGGTVGLVIPAGRLAGGKTPEDAAFLEELCGISTYAKRRAKRIEALPWAKEPLPKKYAILTDLGGYGEGTGYGIRTTDRAVIEAECRTLRQLGVNGLRNAPPFVLEMAGKKEGFAADFRRVRDTHGMGFPVPRANASGPAKSDPESGCPFAPGVAARTKAAVAETVEHFQHQPADEAWALTVDEIGAVFDAAPEGKAHVATCPHCAEGFREYLRSRGLKPADFGAQEWKEVSPLMPTADAPPPADRPAALRTYYTALFINYATAKLFTPLRDEFARLNEEKKKTLAAGDTKSDAATRPYLYSYALRGNTYLMGGHSLDFFEFYRHADNGFVYETSNRDPRVWHWDSHLCDVGRLVSAERGLAFGIYVKPHRGAPIQRAISAAARNCTMFYWYTYGPDWAKGDTFASDEASLAAASQAARLLAASEEVLYGAKWMHPAEIAIVSPRSSEIWMRRAGSPPDRVAAWENAKWIYTALAHAHLPVDPIDEDYLTEKSLDELARYKAIYVSGPNLTAAAADKLARWVERGGILYTSGGGLRLDEANQPLTAMQTVLGLASRKEPEMWRKVKLYGATALESYDDRSVVLAPPPAGAEVRAGDAFVVKPVVGREVLDPGPKTDVLARFADGGAAFTRHAHGKGFAFTVGFFPGLEYSAPLRTDRYDLRRDFDSACRAFVDGPAVAHAVRPVVDCDHPTVEGVLLKNAQNGRRAVAVMNWTYRVAAYRTTAKGARTPQVEHVPLEQVELTIRGAGPIARARLARGGELTVAPDGDAARIVVPRLAEADVILLD